MGFNPLDHAVSSFERSLAAQGVWSDPFEIEPAPLDAWIRDPHFINLGFIPSEEQMLALRHMEWIYSPEDWHALGWTRDDVSLVNFIVLQWGKGSTDPDEQVYDRNTGQWVRLREWRQAPVASVDPDKGTAVDAYGSDSFYEGHGSMYRVTTKRGFAITVWERHKFLAWNRTHLETSGNKVGSFAKHAQGTAWRELRDIEVGEKIALANTLPEPEETLSVDPREIELVGLWIGDGHMPTTRSDKNPLLAVGYASPLIRQRFKDIIESYGCTLGEWHDPERNKSTLSVNKSRRRNVANPVRDLVWKWGLEGSRSATKRIPQEMFSMSNEDIALLVSRLVDTDGWVSTSNTAEIGYGTISRGLAEDVQRLLLRLGVLAHLEEKKTTYKGEPYLSFQVRVREQHEVERLGRQLSLLDKQEKLDQILEALPGTRRAARNRWEDVTWDEVVEIEYVGEDEFWTLTVPGPENYIAAGAFVNHNSGKDTISQVGLLRIVYLLSCLRNPQAYFGIGLHSPIHLTNIAVSSTQANTVFYRPLKDLILQSPFFSDRIGGPMRRPGTTKTIFDKGIELLSGHSDAASQEGMNLLAGVADEIAEFRTREEISKTSRSAGGEGVREAKMSAEGVDAMMRSSGRSRFPDVHKCVYLSWTRFRGDYIQRLYAEGEKSIAAATQEVNRENLASAIEEDNLPGLLEAPSRNRWWISHKSTWEANPSKKRSDFNDEYEKDSENARGKYECIPPRSKDRYFRNTVALAKAFPEQENNPVEFYYDEAEDPDNPGHFGWQAQFYFDEEFVPDRGCLYAVHIDLAHTGDHAGFAMSHVSGYRRREVADDDDSRSIRQEEVTLDLALAFPQGEHGEIELRWARQLVFRLIERGFNILRVTLDGYQCLTGETEVPLLDGSTRTMAELVTAFDAGEEMWTYSSTPEGRVVPGRVTSARSVTEQEIWEVELDNGDVVSCTGTHPFMLRDGTYLRAEELTVGTSLMPLYRRERKVREVRRTGRFEMTYDLTVEDHENFAVEAGVFVHNSVDTIQILNAALGNRNPRASSEERRIADRYSLDRTTEGYDTLKNLIYSGLYHGYRLPAANEGTVHEEECIWWTELQSLQKIGGASVNARVDHPPFGCFVGETRIPLLDGSFPTIAELDGRDVWVYSARESGEFVPGKARGRLTKHTRDLVDVILDSGATIRCTPEHRFMLRTGDYKEAQHIRPGIDRLMSLNQTWPVNGGYERITNRDGYRELTHRLVSEHVDGPIPEGWLVHHKNDDKTDNQPENLEQVPPGAHAGHHTSRRWAEDPDYRDAVASGLAAFNNSEEGRRKHSEAMARTNAATTREQRLARARAKQNFRDDIDLSSLESVRHDPEATNANAVARILGCGRNVVMRVLREHGFQTWDGFLSAEVGVNHKVRAVIHVRLGEPVPVYDLEVDEWSNFLLAPGVVVHNSKDIGDAIAGSCVGAIHVARVWGGPSASDEDSEVWVGGHGTTASQDGFQGLAPIPAALGLHDDPLVPPPDGF